MTLVGFGTAGLAFAAMVTASGGVSNDNQGLVGGVINNSRQIGAAIGATLLPAVLATDATGPLLVDIILTLPGILISARLV